MEIGIENISFFSPNYYIDLEKLARKRGVDPLKFKIGIGQVEQTVLPPDQDTISMALNSASKIVDDSNKNDIDLVLFATESGVDNSKAASIYIHKFLDLKPETRTIELKQACYSATAGLVFAQNYINANPNKKVLVIASDVSRYGLGTPGEVTQGAGSISMIISRNPKIASFIDKSTFITETSDDFWRPLYSDVAFVDGKLSTEIYKGMFKKLWEDYKKINNTSIEDSDAFIFHLPFTKIGNKALNEIIDEADNKKKLLLDNLEASKKFGSRNGNLYTGSLYLSLISLLENKSKELKPGNKITLFSYGSGAEAELFSIKLNNFKNNFNETKYNLDNRTEVPIEEYEKWFKINNVLNSSNYINELQKDNSPFRYTGQKNNLRIYKKII